MQETFASGNWIVKDGREEEFVGRWTEFLTWTRDVPGFVNAALIRETDNQRHFISFSEWTSYEAAVDWSTRPEFAAKLGACKELCDEFFSSRYKLASSVAVSARV